jgi:hypothetical protein
MKPISYVRHRFPPEVIRHAVWLYRRFTLSHRDVEDLLVERGVEVSNESVRRWVLKFARGSLGISVGECTPRTRISSSISTGISVCAMFALKPDVFGSFIVISVGSSLIFQGFRPSSLPSEGRGQGFESLPERMKMLCGCCICRFSKREPRNFLCSFAASGCTSGAARRLLPAHLRRSRVPRLTTEFWPATDSLL